MGLRERIEEEIRAALRNADGESGQRINVTSRVNRVVARNVGGGHAAASAEQTAPVVQGPPLHPDEASSD